MSATEENGVHWRNALLAFATAFLMLALADEFRDGARISALPWLVAWLVMAAGGLFAALGIREFAGLIFRLDDKPWYAQRGGVFFLLVMLAIINVLAIAALAYSHLARWLPSGLSLLGHAYACMSAELFWVAVLDWPRASRPAAHTPKIPPRARPTEDVGDTTPPRLPAPWQPPPLTPTSTSRAERGATRNLKGGLLKKSDENETVR